MKEEPTNVLLIHNNFPGQFYRAILRLAGTTGIRVTFISSPNLNRIAGVRRIDFAPPAGRTAMERLQNRGLQVYRIINQLIKSGERFDLALAHAPTGDAFYLPAIIPDTPLITLPEFYLDPKSDLIKFISGQPPSSGMALHLEQQKSIIAKSIVDADLSLVPTLFQKSQFPAVLQERLTVLHEGIDDTLFLDHPPQQQTLPNGRRLSPGQQIVTFITRSLEPVRGYDVFTKAAEILLKQNPSVIIVVAGNEDHAYFPVPPGARNWRTLIESKVNLPADRFIFTGLLDRANYINLLRLSAAHIYLTAPFVPSWSLLEAMALGSMIVASDTAPVREFLRDGHSALLTAFHDHARLAEVIETVLQGKVDTRGLRHNARVAASAYKASSCTGALLKHMASLLPAERRPVLENLAATTPS